MLSVATPARAQDRPIDYDAAKRHYQAGEEASRKGEFGEAAKRYGMAYEITKDPVLFYKIATAYDAGGDCKAAVIYYRRYLGEAKPEQRFVEKTEAKIAACEQKKQTAGSAGRSPDATAPPAGGPDSGGAAAPTGPVAAATDDEAPPTAGPPAFADTGTTWMESAAWGAVGTAFTFATIGGVLGLSASSREEDIENLFATVGEPETYEGAIKARYLDLIDEGERLEVFSYVAFGVAGAAALVAAGLFVFDRSPAADGEASLAPVVAPGQAGVSAAWSF